MNYKNETLRNVLAAEYVLGTLRGGARRRYQQLMMESQLITETTWMWEQYLNGLGQNMQPVEPPASIWQAIERQLARRGPRLGGHKGHPAATRMEFNTRVDYVETGRGCRVSGVHVRLVATMTLPSRFLHYS